MKTVTIKMSDADLNNIAESLACTLECETVGVPENADYYEVVNAWRKYSPFYSERQMASGWDKASADAAREANDRDADLLERLYDKFPFLLEAEVVA